ncbi:MAG TPA: type II toxin-antitoxin system VapC family toxin [Thermoanaerobaculia bacterium]|nr:type II toxin-antitoxin system VapC family toxin [Thermoanaerobaculia bacterium]
MTESDAHPLNVVDSSAWLEYFADGPNAERFAEPIQNGARLLVPTLVVYEVFKRLLVVADEDSGRKAVAMMYTGSVVTLSEDLALRAAVLSVEHKLPLADSVILATARAHEALLWTQDGDFEGLPGVHCFQKSNDL